uniref:NADH dehydrogenase subunit 5 n=1 Tax=Anchon yunnanense TaxID=2885775 RepID=UPI001EDE1775|nr:NADH dehydrogenase subunit 5 [Anchon yunnanense]UKB86903.1 NADH dehydrogenase subunit 5 [Anchon yunnanense]
MFNKYMFWFIFMIIFSLLMFYLGLWFMIEDMCFFLEYSVMFINSLTFYYVLIFDWKSLLFMSVVMFISSMVVFYSSLYMGYGSLSCNRFLYLVLLFIMSMVLMVLSPNLISILLGWDGLGLVSYCLVIYYSSVSSNLSGMITLLTNRLGDIGILISISWIFSFGGWNFIFYNFYFDNFIFFMVVLSSFTKSAQAPFSCWLPAAMAAPTPVSALVHSSTLVTAGVYLLIRFFSGLYLFNLIFSLIGLFTMVFSSFCCNFEFDLKKIIAFSTLSQLGLMMMSIFLGFMDFSFYHMLTHAMFKSLLFLCSGIYIYNYMDNQDIRYMGGCCSFMPLTSSCFNISSMCLCGLPFLSGFYSKDMIIEVSVFYGFNYIFFFLFYLSLGLTCCYSFRLVYYSLIKSFNFMPLNCIKSELNYMGMSVYFMSFFSIIFGCFLNWLINIDMIWLFFPLYLKVLSFFSVFLGIWFGYEFNSFNYMFNLTYYNFNSSMWFMFSYSSYLINFFLCFFLKYSLILFWGEYYLSFKMLFYLNKFSDFLQFYLNNSIKIFLISYVLVFIIWF